MMPKRKTRLDRFQIGDRVEFIDEDPYIGFGMGERHRSQHGKGPYLVEDIEDATNGSPHAIDCGIVPHAQELYVNGHRYSGAWFKPLRPEEPRDHWPMPKEAAHESH